MCDIFLLYGFAVPRDPLLKRFNRDPSSMIKTLNCTIPTSSFEDDKNVFRADSILLYSIFDARSRLKNKVSNAFLTDIFFMLFTIRRNFLGDVFVCLIYALLSILYKNISYFLLLTTNLLVHFLGFLVFPPLANLPHGVFGIIPSPDLPSPPPCGCERGF